MLALFHYVYPKALISTRSISEDTLGNVCVGGEALSTLTYFEAKRCTLAQVEIQWGASWGTDDEWGEHALSDLTKQPVRVPFRVRYKQKAHAASPDVQNIFADLVQSCSEYHSL